MPVVTINGIRIEAQQGRTIIEAARENGIKIPHYCWHPGLSVAGNCRMCLVEVEKMPKPAIACATQVADGMVVHTDSEKAKHAREAVMEFLLINHPLDCPICDEAGQCKLQDYTFKFSAGQSRFEEEKNHKPKRQEIGPHVMLDDERCIMCSRCVRFSEEIAHQPVFTFINRGDHVVLAVAPNTVLDNPYSMNVIDLCPVGALTSREFRFKSRVWDMSWTESVCPGCARGCNIDIGARNNAILRLDPRENKKVNQWWMCDEGRLHSWDHVQAATRITTPFARIENSLKAVSLTDAVQRAAVELKKVSGSSVAFVCSPFATNEDNYAARKLSSLIKGSTMYIADHLNGVNDELLIRADRTPNALGARIAAMEDASASANISALKDRIASGAVKCLYVVDEDVAKFFGAELLRKLSAVIVQSSNENATTAIASVVLPAATFAEVEGTFTNFNGFVQLIKPALATQENEARMGMQASRLDTFGTLYDRWAQGKKLETVSHWRLMQSVAHELDATWAFTSSENVFDEFVSQEREFKGLTYELLEERNGAALATAAAVDATL